MVQVQETSSESASSEGVPRPVSELVELARMRKNEEIFNAPDMDVEGNWTSSQAASMKAGMKFAQSVQRNNIDVLEKEATQPTITSSEVVSGLDAAFGAGDASISFKVSDNYYMTNDFGSETTRLYNGSEEILTAEPGQKRLRFDPPNGQVVQVISQSLIDVQHMAVAGLIKDAPQMGAQAPWNIPSFSTDQGESSFSAFYEFNPLVPRARQRLSAKVRFNSTNEKRVEMNVRDYNGNEIVSSEFTLSGQEAYRISASYIGFFSGGLIEISGGLIEIRSPGNAMVVSETEISPARAN